MLKGNEWKTRYENQEEINRHLVKQAASLETKIEEVKLKIRNSIFKILFIINK